MKKTMLSFRLHPDVVRKLKRISELSGLSQAQLLEVAFVHFCNHVAPADMEKKYHLVMMTLFP